MQSDEWDVDDDRMIRIVVKHTTCNPQSSIKKGGLTIQMYNFCVLQHISKALSYLHELNVFAVTWNFRTCYFASMMETWLGVARLPNFGYSRHACDQEQRGTFITQT